MKIPITLVPQGVIPRDPDMTLRLTKQTEPTTTAITAGGVPTVAIGNGLLSEDLTEAVFTVTLSATWPFVVTVNWATEDDTALDGVDYTAGSGTVTFAPNETTQTITVALLGAGAVDDRRFNVNLSNPVGALITSQQGVARIPGTPPACIFTDTFSGAGTIDGHTADSGGSWTVLSPTPWQGQDPSAPIADLTLADEGMQITHAGFSDDGFVGMVPSVQPTALPFEVELRFTPYSRGGTDQGFRTRFVVSTLVDTFKGAWFLIFVDYNPGQPDDGSIQIESEFGSDDGNFHLDEGVTIYVDSPIASFVDVEHSVVMKFLADRIDAFCDGVQVGTITDATALTRYASIVGNSKDVQVEVGNMNDWTGTHGVQYSMFRICPLA